MTSFSSYPPLVRQESRICPSPSHPNQIIACVCVSLRTRTSCTRMHPFMSSQSVLPFKGPPPTPPRRPSTASPGCRQMASNEKVNSKQHDKAGTRLSGATGDLAFRDVSISFLAHLVQFSAPLSIVKDTRPIKAYRMGGFQGEGEWGGCTGCIG